jgi:nucleolar protein 15
LSPKKESTPQKIAGINGTIKAKGTDNAANKVNDVKDKSATAAKKSTGLKLPKPIDEEEDVGQLADEEDEDDEVSDVDDQTEALLKGFESDGYEEDENQEGLQFGQAIPKIPKKSKKALKRAQLSELSEKPGVIYVGRIPHGFYENEMREYFEQFGKILKLRMSRNRKTGASRHFAFIQFESASVADIVTRTMDGYLMFNHILKVQSIPNEQVHDSLFIGANKRFKKVPWNKIRGRELDMGASEATWEKRIEKEEKRRETKAEKAKNLLGYDFEAPKIKSATGVAKKPVEQLTLTASDENEIKAIEAAPAVAESSKPKTKKGKNAKAESECAVVIKEVEAAPVVEPIVEEPAKLKKEKKSKKAKDTDATSSVPVSEPRQPAPVTDESGKPKAKKDKKAKELTAATSVPVTEEPSKPKTKKEKKTKPVEGAETPTVSATDLPKKLKTKKSKGDLAEETTAGDEAGEQKKKSKKGKKVQTDA